MNLKLKQRGSRYSAHGTIAGRFLRLALGTRNYSEAEKVARRIGHALAEGQDSSLWPELKRVLPPRTFEKVVKIGNYSEKAPAKVMTWKDLEAAFAAEMSQRVALGKLAESTRARYKQTLKAFTGFLDACGVCDLPAMNRAFMEKFKVYRLAKIEQKKFSRGGRGPFR